MTTEVFRGFPSETFAFLEGLEANNQKDWFEANRRRYQTYYVEPALGLISVLGPRLKTISTMIQAEPRVNGSLFRINRDVRFPQDKTPYKSHLDMWFWTGERKGWDSPGLFFRMFHDRLMLGAGVHHFEKGLLDLFRAAALDERKGPALQQALDTVQQAGYKIGGATRKALPRGFDTKNPRSSLLLHEGLWAEIASPIPAEARSAAFVDYCCQHYAAMWPIGQAVVEATKRS